MQTIYKEEKYNHMLSKHISFIYLYENIVLSDQKDTVQKELCLRISECWALWELATDSYRNHILSE